MSGIIAIGVIIVVLALVAILWGIPTIEKVKAKDKGYVDGYTFAMQDFEVDSLEEDVAFWKYHSNTYSRTSSSLAYNDGFIKGNKYGHAMTALTKV
jgi:hypothetical protein